MLWKNVSLLSLLWVFLELYYQQAVDNDNPQGRVSRNFTYRNATPPLAMPTAGGSPWGHGVRKKGQEPQPLAWFAPNKM